MSLFISIAWAWDAILVSRLVLRVESVKSYMSADDDVIKDNGRDAVDVFQMDVWVTRRAPVS